MPAMRLHCWHGWKGHSKDMIHVKQDVTTLWERITVELATVFDVHGVCATIATEVAHFADTAAIVALCEPNGRYYDVWISQPDGQTEQTRWESDKVNLDMLTVTGHPQLHYKHAQSARHLVNNDLWFIPKESALVVPLPYPARPDPVSTLGLLCVVDPPPDADEHLHNMGLVTMFMTTYLERAALRAQTHRQAVEFSVITDISHSLSSTLRLEEIFDRVAGEIRGLLDVETVSLALLDSATGNIVFVPELMGALFMEIPLLELAPGEGIAGWVAKNGQSLIVQDVYADRRFYRQSDKLSGFQTNSILCVPLVAEQRVIGVMEAINKQSGDFTAHDQMLLEGLSGPLATAIVNARLHQEAVAEKRRIETIFQSMSEGMLTVTHEGVITAVNDAFLTLIHRQRQEVIGKNAQDVLQLKKQSLADFFHDVLTTTAEPDEYPQLACELKQNGDYVPVLAGGAPIFNEAGKVREMVIAFSDLRQIRELERMRDDFFHSIIHELRTPLALILMYARLLLNGRAGDDEEKMERFLRTIEQESDRLQRMVRQMLELAKLEASEIQRSSEPISMNDILDEVVPPLADKATEKGLIFQQKIEPDLPYVLGDRPTLYMIFKNLTENAIKFTPSGTICLEAYVAQDKIVVKVSDEGIGIPEAAMPNLFKRFYRTQTAVERGIAGTGIGLSLVKEGVEKHKGEITVHSPESDGTTFEVRLPVMGR